MSPVRVAIAGCNGRMGRALVRLCAADSTLKLVGALTEPGDSLIGMDASACAGGGRFLGVAMTTALTRDSADVVVEFTKPEGTAHWAEWCAENGVALVSGTTGLGHDKQAILAHAAERTPIVSSGNMSVGINVLLRIAADVATRLGDGWDIEITETHHRHKVDAPSGTARMLRDAISAALGRDAESNTVHGRRGTTVRRPAEQIGMHSLRMGEVIGDHEVFFGGAGEVISLTHRALSRDTFAAGALRAARWIVGRKPQLYSMQDVLFG